MNDTNIKVFNKGINNGNVNIINDSAQEIWELSNSSSRTWDRFVAEFLNAIGGEQKKDYLEEHPSRNGEININKKILDNYIKVELWGNKYKVKKEHKLTIEKIQQLIKDDNLDEALRLWNSIKADTSIIVK